MRDEETDHIDKLIREAANRHHPAYDDKALQKMIQLLDKHLPQKKEKRRTIFFLLLTLFFIGGTIFTIAYLLKNNNTADSGKTIGSSKAIGPVQTASKELNPVDAAPVNDKKSANAVSIKLFPVNSSDEPVEDLKALPNAHKHFGKHSFIKNALAEIGNDLPKTSLAKAKNNDPFEGDNNKVAGNIENTATPFDRNSIKQNVSSNTNPIKAKDDNPVINIPAETKETKKEDPVKQTSKQGFKIEKKKNRFANNFAVTFSAGADLSFVDINEPGKTSLYYGAGLSYSFNRKFAIRGGFYVAQKIYSADSYEYHPPAGYWTYNADLERVDANCKVYEIPLSISYNFIQSKHHAWFGSIGISSYLMKRETYNYLYKDALGQTQYKGWTLRDKNRHYFSVLTISGGYQYRVNNNFSIVAEPYFKLPLDGVGFGKIKLNSSGLLITVNIKPFAKK